MKKKFIEYDSRGKEFRARKKTGFFGYDQENIYSINAYDNSSKSIVFDRRGPIPSLQEKVMKMRRWQWDALFILYMFGSVAIIAAIAVLPAFIFKRNDSIFFLVGLLISMTIPFIGIKMERLRPDNDSTVFLEGIGDHITDEDIDRFTALHRALTREKFISAVQRILVQKDPTGVRPELVEEYNEYMREQAEIAEINKNESLKMINSLDLNQPPLSVRMQEDARQKATEDWQQKLNDIAS